MSRMTLTGKASIDRPWMKYYPKMLLDNLRIPECSLRQYLGYNIHNLDTVAIHYYGAEITWKQVFENANACARSLKALGFGVGDQIPTFLRSVPEFIYLLLAAEKIGASLLCRDNTIHENVDAVIKSRSHTIIAHDFLSKEEMNMYVDTAHVKNIVLLPPCLSCNHTDMPTYIRTSLASNYSNESAHGKEVMSWNDFLELGDTYTDTVDAPLDIDRPLFRCYTSGSTGPSKQVIHSAHTIIGVLGQMNFYGGEAEQRPTWMVATLPPALAAVVISMLLLPLASNKLLIMNPWVDVYDIDLELMRYKPNNMPMIPMFIEVLMGSNRIPENYDMSHILALGAGAEACNNTQLRRVQKFLKQHNCHVPFTTGYGSSEAGSNVTFHISGKAAGNGNVGCPMPLTNVGIFKPGTTEELGYNQNGEICVCGPGVMLGYDNADATAKALVTHPDGNVWLHMGDMGFMDEEGHLHTAGRGSSKRFGGGFLDLLPMENMLADANIPGIIDQFFVNIPDADHKGYYEPYLYVVLQDGYSIDDIRLSVNDALQPHMIPTHIIQLPERPFWHFKTNRIGLANKVLEARATKAHLMKRKDVPQQIPAAAPAPAPAQKDTGRGIRPGTAEKLAVVVAILSLMLGLVLLIGSAFTVATVQIVLFTVGICCLFQCIITLVFLMMFLYSKR